MTIIEAIKSGKAFKRKAATSWLIYQPDKFTVHQEVMWLRYLFTSDDILADDWIVREE